MFIVEQRSNVDFPTSHVLTLLHCACFCAFGSLIPFIRHHSWPLCAGDVPGLYFQHALVKHSLYAGETAESVPLTCSGNAFLIHIGDISVECVRYVSDMCSRHKWLIAQVSLTHWGYPAGMYRICSRYVFATQVTHREDVRYITRHTRTYTQTHRQ